MPWFVSMRIITLRALVAPVPLLIVVYRMSVILRSEGDDKRGTFEVVFAIVSSKDILIKPVRAIPPIAVFLRKERRLSLVEGLLISVCIAAASACSCALFFSA